MPRDGSNQGNNESSKKTSVEEILKAVRDTKDILFSFFELDTRDTGNEKHTGHNAKLTPNHESGESVCVVVE